MKIETYVRFRKNFKFRLVETIITAFMLVMAIKYQMYFLGAIAWLIHGMNIEFTKN